MNSSCGCGSAEQCWTSCCCHSPAERLVWAKACGIDPPVQFAVDSQDVDHARSERTCCASKTHGCVLPASVTGADPALASAEPISEAPESKEDGLVGLQRLICQGQGINWLTAVVFLPPVPVVWTDDIPVARFESFSEPSVHPFRLPPPVPPPRLAVL